MYSVYKAGLKEGSMWTDGYNFFYFGSCHAEHKVYIMTCGTQCIQYYFRSLCEGWLYLQEKQWLEKKKSYGNTELENWNVCDMQNQSSVVNRFHYLRRSVKSGMITIIRVVMGNYQDDINHSLTASHPVCILTRIHPYCHPSTCIVSGNARHWYCN